jgi:phosphatidylserine decarboxylase
MRPSYNPTIGIAIEGWIVLLAVIALWWALSATGYPLAGWCVLALLLPLAAFFVDRGRSVPSKPRGVLAPVDGHVIYRREAHDPLLDRESIRIGIRVSWWGSYALRSPVEGEVDVVDDSRHRASIIRTDEGEHFVIQVRRGSLFGALPVWVPVGDRVGQGRRCGLRRFAREIDLYLPAGARVEVPLGSRVRCGQTLIATIVRRKT